MNKLSEKITKLYNQYEDIIEEMRTEVFSAIREFFSFDENLQEITVEVNLYGQISDIKLDMMFLGCGPDRIQEYIDHVKRGIFSLLVPLTGETLLMVIDEFRTSMTFKRDDDRLEPIFGWPKTEPKMDLYEEWYVKKETS